jgi:H+/Cl- antiporter ClcA
MTDLTIDNREHSEAAEVERLERSPHLGHVLVVALMVGLFAAVWLVAYEKINDVIWGNSFVAGHRWMIPVGVLLFSLLVGLVGKYLHAYTMVQGGVDECLKAGEVTTYKNFWGTLLSSFFSLFSGASVGPEGALGYLAVQVSQWLAYRLKFTREGTIGIALAGMSAAYNGVVGNPVFATLLATEVSGGKGGFALLGSNLLGGAIGFLVFALLGIPAFAGFLNIGQPVSFAPGWVLWAVGLGLLGALLALYMAVVVRGAARLMGRFDGRPLVRILVAAIIVGVVCYFIPELMFSGEKSIHGIMANPAGYGLGMLLLMAILKPVLLAVSLKGGFLGGPIFPALFTAVMVALIISLLVPGVPLSVLVPCLEVGVVTLLLRAPLTAILLVVVIAAAGASADLVELVTISAAASLGVGLILQRRMAQKAQAQPVQSVAAAE